MQIQRETPRHASALTWGWENPGAPPQPPPNSQFNPALQSIGWFPRRPHQSCLQAPGGRHCVWASLCSDPATGHLGDASLAPDSCCPHLITSPEPHSTPMKHRHRHSSSTWQAGGAEGKEEEGMATHSNILVWKIPQTEEPGKLWSMESQRVGHNWSNSACRHPHTHTPFYLGVLSWKFYGSSLHLSLWPHTWVGTNLGTCCKFITIKIPTQSYWGRTQVFCCGWRCEHTLNSILESERKEPIRSGVGNLWSICQVQPAACFCK